MNSRGRTALHGLSKGVEHQTYNTKEVFLESKPWPHSFMPSVQCGIFGCRYFVEMFHHNNFDVILEYSNGIQNPCFQPIFFNSFSSKSQLRFQGVCCIPIYPTGALPRLTHLVPCPLVSFAFPTHAVSTLSFSSPSALVPCRASFARTYSIHSASLEVLVSRARSCGQSGQRAVLVFCTKLYRKEKHFISKKQLCVEKLCVVPVWNQI